MKKLLLFSLSALLLGSFVMTPRAHAESLIASVGINAGCSAYTNPSSVTVVAGNDVNITVNNLSFTSAVTVSGPGASGQLGKNNKTATDNNRTFILGVVTSPVSLSFSPIPTTNNDPTLADDCPLGSNPQSAVITINPVAPATPPAAKTVAPKAAATNQPANTTVQSATPPTTQEAATAPTDVMSQNTAPSDTAAKQAVNAPNPVASRGVVNSANVSLSLGIIGLIGIAWFLVAKQYIPVNSLKRFRRK